ncbi:hypothetical protein [Ruminococcus sp.]|uniref:hypothetical protein n=1 Tax=Ruminococcus sp. TaxID=41978 RepID=UPI00399FA030
MGDRGVRTHRNKPEHPDEIVEIRHRIVKIQEQNFHLLNMLNSFTENAVHR